MFSQKKTDRTFVLYLSGKHIFSSINIIKPDKNVKDIKTKNYKIISALLIFENVSLVVLCKSHIGEF